ncbi:LysR family transcriptional regulator [Parvibaculum sp.]|uniref:LysR family transcriptional regulator n=1 Tax=Parvibaculum sp. TaxID=2024848 RepID=UPI000C8B2D82|nr:LysR family transcriptional regulator [Parvibaculum sp.]MAB14060.1 hypothetical protein [Parvibaculum sp.]
MDMRQIRHFDALYRLRSFRLAADEQGLTHSALTKSLQRLEADTGLSLFDRTTRQVVPTSAGERLAARARELLRGMGDFEAEARALKGGMEGNLRIGASPQPAESLVIDALTRFTPANPTVRVAMESALQPDLIGALMAREIDFAVLGWIAFEPVHFEEDVLIEQLGAEPSVIVAREGHPLVQAGAPSEAYLDYPWAAAHFAEEDYRHFPGDFAVEMKRRGIPQLRLESVSASLELSRRTDILTGVARSIGERAVERGGVTLVEYPFEVETRYAILRRRDRSLLPAAGRLRAEIVEIARERGWRGR